MSKQNLKQLEKTLKKKDEKSFFFLIRTKKLDF